MIGYATQEGLLVHIYDINNRELFQITGELFQFTTESVIIRDHYTLYYSVWNSEGKQVQQLKIQRTKCTSDHDEHDGCSVLLFGVITLLLLGVLLIIIH